jgi:hypothetical protein|tara:strand:- start:28 stop:231 length:204 start_codon:yes stop_codon:yes gene_type:complete
MSREKINNIEEIFNEPRVDLKKTSGRVDINHLIANVRKRESAENKVNFIFLGLFAALILIVGILLSL